jgi:hypothetical protein
MERGRNKKEEKSEYVHSSMVCDLDHSSWSIYAMHQVPTLGRNVP